MSGGALISVGYEGRSVEDLVGLLTSHGVRVLVDVRLNAVSRKKGFSKKALAATLRAAGIGYRHEPALGNPTDNRDAFRRGDAGARARFVEQLSLPEAATVCADIAGSATAGPVALLCFERDHGTCHRSCVAEVIGQRAPTLELALV